MSKPRRGAMCAGGGLKGAMDPPILATWDPNDYLFYLGTSVSAVNGAPWAQGMLYVAEDFWANIDTKSVLQGVNGFLQPNYGKILFWGSAALFLQLLRLTNLRDKALKRMPNSLFSMAPLHTKVKEHLRAKKLKTTFGCGVVPRSEEEHHTLHFTAASDDTEYQMAVMASSSIAFLMNPWLVMFNGREKLTSDGGHVSVAPYIPEEWLSEIDEVDVILHFPLVKETLGEDEVDGFFESMLWFLEMQLASQRETTLEYLKGLVRAGKRVRIFAPRIGLGNLMGADRATLEARKAEGDWVKDHPVVWEAEGDWDKSYPYDIPKSLGEV